MKRLYVVALVPLVAFASCSKSDEPTMAQVKKMEETSKKICEKMFTCIDEQLQTLPAEQRDMARSMMGGKEACYKRYGVEEAADNGKSDDPGVTYTKEEVDLALQCMDEITKVSCQQLMNEESQPASCKKLSEIAQKKGSK